MIKKTYKVDGMHCASCAMVIESDLSDAGIDARCSYARQTIDVVFDQTIVTEIAIEEIVKKSGYTLKK